MATIETIESLRKDLVGNDSWFIKHLDAIQQEVDERFVELPVDADGEVIRVGDELTYCEDDQRRVIALMLDNDPEEWGGELGWSIQREGEGAPTANNRFFRHYHKPTVEDVLREFAAIYIKTSGRLEEDEVFAEYAEKLRLADE